MVVVSEAAASAEKMCSVGCSITTCSITKVDESKVDESKIDETRLTKGIWPFYHRGRVGHTRISGSILYEKTIK